MRQIILLMSAILLFTGCNSVQKTVNPEKFAVTKQLVESGQYKVIQYEAQPLVTNEIGQLGAGGFLGQGNTGSLIFLQGQSNYININENLVEGNLAYFGEVRMAMNQTQTGAIQFEPDTLTNYTVTFDETKSRYTITFNAKNNSESFDVRITVYPNGNTDTVVISSHRNSIQYRGRIRGLPSKKV